MLCTQIHENYLSNWPKGIFYNSLNHSEIEGERKNVTMYHKPLVKVPSQFWVFTLDISIASKMVLFVSIQHSKVDLQRVEDWASLNPKYNFHT